MPLAIYLIFLGLLNLGPSPKVFTGRLDRMYLYAGVSGLVIYGPIQILLPSNAVIRFGDHVWYPMMVLYFFGVLAISMVSRPQLVIYNLSYQDFSLLLSRVKKVEFLRNPPKVEGRYRKLANIEVAPLASATLFSIN